MDPLAEFMALSPCDTSVNSSLADDNTTQCSADASAFTGFRSTSSTWKAGRHMETNSAGNTSATITNGSGSTVGHRMKLTLNLASQSDTTDEIRLQGVSVSQLSPSNSQQTDSAGGSSYFSELFYEETQDEEEEQKMACEGDSADDKKTADNKRPTPLPSLLSLMEEEWRKRKEAKKNGNMSATSAGTSGADENEPVQLPLKMETSESSAYSEDLAKIDFRHPFRPAGICNGNIAISHCVHDEVEGVVLKDDNENDNITDNDDDDMGGRRDSIDSISETQTLADCEEDIEAIVETETMNDVDECLTNDEEPDVKIPIKLAGVFTNGSTTGKQTNPTTAVAQIDSHLDEHCDITSLWTEVVSNKANGKYDSEEINLTPIAKKIGASNHHSAKQETKPPLHSLTDTKTVDRDDGNAVKIESSGEDLRTQPSKPKSPSLSIPLSTPSVIPSESTQSPLHRAGLKKREKHIQPVLTGSQERSYQCSDPTCTCGKTVCQCASIQFGGIKSSSVTRNLELSFATPESQGGELQFLGNVSDADAVASKALEIINEEDKMPILLQRVQNESSILKAPTAEPETTNAYITEEDTPNKSSHKKRENSTPSSAVKKKKKLLVPSPDFVISSTPSNRKRKRAFLSPDAGQSAIGSDIDTTPRTSARSRSKPSTMDTFSTSSVRTRPKILSAHPTHRAYASRSRTLFKYKFEFCLTGFMKDGEVGITELIEGHGGKICDQDILNKRNTKAVVIATPVSWRKLKFMYAVACGIPVVHPEWIHACIKAEHVVSFDGYYVPSGYSVTTRKFECLPVKKLDVFAGYSFGIPHDVKYSSSSSVKGMGSLMHFVLNACGAVSIIEDLTISREKQVDIILSDEYTKVCEYYQSKHQIPIKSFSWVTECIVLQRFLDPATVDFEPQRKEQRKIQGKSRENVIAANAQIGGNEQTVLKLLTGELVLADLSGDEIDHFLLFHVCEILNIYITRTKEDDTTKKRAEDEEVILRVGVLKRTPNSPGLVNVYLRTLEIPASKVKRRVVAVSKVDFKKFKYRDESVFYFEESKPE